MPELPQQMHKDESGAAFVNEDEIRWRFLWPNFGVGESIHFFFKNAIKSKD